jgi:feruloyl esterase
VGREIRFRLLLPDDWNRKFMMGGGGGFVGGIDNQAVASINAGYATVGTDTGHQGSVTTAAWALNDIERQLNFGHVGVHRVAETAKTIVRHYYNAGIERSYFSGCSNGGRQALMAAQRYQDDFDGIIAGAPQPTGIGAQFIGNIRPFRSGRRLAPAFWPRPCEHEPDRREMR